jgi:hypothetical protein
MLMMPFARFALLSPLPRFIERDAAPPLIDALSLLPPFFADAAAMPPFTAMLLPLPLSPPLRHAIARLPDTADAAAPYADATPRHAMLSRRRRRRHAAITPHYFR